MFEIIEVDPLIIANMRDRLNPRKEFSYKDGDHIKGAIENEKRMREKSEGKMSYRRVIPRDLFNEAKLLKCLAFISLKIHDGKIQGLNINHEDESRGFKIEQNDLDGSIHVSNLHFFDEAGTPVYFCHPLNNKGNFPLLMEYKDEVYFPFNESGEYQLAHFLFKKEK